ALGELRRVGFAAAGGEAGAQRRIGRETRQRGGEGGGVLERRQQAALAVADELARPGGGGGDNGALRCPGLDDDIAERLVTRRGDEKIGGGEQGRDIVAPAEEAHAPGDAERNRLAFEIAAQRALAGEPEMEIGN